jgi:hypothetical protein
MFRYLLHMHPLLLLGGGLVGYAFYKSVTAPPRSASVSGHGGGGHGGGGRGGIGLFYGGGAYDEDDSPILYFDQRQYVTET